MTGETKGANDRLKRVWRSRANDEPRKETDRMSDQQAMPGESATKKRSGMVHPIIVFPYSFPDPLKNRGVGLENLKDLCFLREVLRQRWNAYEQTSVSTLSRVKFEERHW
jgi:hypothetical protein